MSALFPKIISPARLLSSKAHIIPGQFLVTELWFEVPKDHSDVAAGTLKLFGRAVTHAARATPPKGPPDFSQRPWMVYLQGGPGMGNPDPQDFPPTRFLLNKGYQVLFLDYRGVGWSTPVTADTLALQGGPQQQADYLKHFRQTQNVLDLEAVRECLTDACPPEKKQWSLFGQSFGGFVILSYLSHRPQGLREVFMTGGMAPVGRPAEDVYAATFKKVAERNQAFFAKYPEDVDNVQVLAHHIAEKGGYDLPGGGRLTVPRMMTMGQAFGGHGGLDQVHATLGRMRADLDTFGFFTRPILTAVESFTPFDVVPIYAILHEAIYCYTKGVASRWAADRVGRQLEPFRWLNTEKPVAPPDYIRYTGRPAMYFSGEMIFPFFFDVFPELARIKEAAEILAHYDGWDDLYDEAQLARNEVPVYAATYIDDMYVDYGLARETTRKVNGVRSFETNTMYHTALRAKSDEVLAALFKLKEDTID